MTEREMLWESFQETMHDFKNVIKLVLYAYFLAVLAIIGMVIYIFLSLFDLVCDACLRKIHYSSKLALWFDRLATRYVFKRVLAYQIC